MHWAQLGFWSPMSRLLFNFVSFLHLLLARTRFRESFLGSGGSSVLFQIQYPSSGGHAKYSCWVVVCHWPHIFMLLPRVSKTLSPRWFEVKTTKRACTKVTSNRIPRYTFKIGELGIHWIICTCMSLPSSLYPPTAWNSDSCGVPEWVPWGSSWGGMPNTLVELWRVLDPIF